jgi:hypothetical protein
MTDDSRNTLRITVTIGAAMALFATVLPWYSFEVVLPVAGIVHIFAVTATLWGFTTLAPILIIVGAFVAMLLAGFVSRPLANVVIVLIGLALVIYAVVRCFDIPSLGVPLVRTVVPATTQLEGGPFITLSGGLLLVLGALGDLLTAPTGMGAGSGLSARWRGRSPVPPSHAAG